MKRTVKGCTQIKKITAYWLVGYALMIFLAGCNFPTPLYHVYSRQWNFSSGILTLIFAVYAILVIPSLLFFGHISDQLGRRRMIAVSLMLGLIGSALLAAAQSVAWLFAARALQGIGTGIISGSATAGLVELQPAGDRRRAALTATVATAAGIAVGPLFAGLLAQYAPWSLTLPYLVHIVFLLPAALLIWAIPEQDSARLREVVWQPRRPKVPKLSTPV
jgi:MFS family permease